MVPRREVPQQSRRVPEGWTRRTWMRAYNAANSKIYRQEGVDASRTARKNGRTPEEAEKNKAKYSAHIGKPQSFFSVHQRAPIMLTSSFYRQLRILTSRFCRLL